MGSAPGLRKPSPAPRCSADRAGRGSWGDIRGLDRDAFSYLPGNYDVLVVAHSARLRVTSPGSQHEAMFGDIQDITPAVGGSRKPGVAEVGNLEPGRKGPVLPMVVLELSRDLFKRVPGSVIGIGPLQVFEEEDNPD